MKLYQSISILLIILNTNFLIAQTAFGPQRVITDKEMYGLGNVSYVIAADLDNDGDSDLISG